MSQLKRSKHLKISLEEIKKATKNLEVCIGKGGYGKVYKGELIIFGKPTPVAIKRLNEQRGQGLKEFLTEIQLLSGQKHPNLIHLYGYCDEEKEKIIVYEYAERGSLDKYLRCDNATHTLRWVQRLKVCVGAARGLDHLHNHVGKHQAIIHRDIKSANILIDKNWVAKVSDLGLSKLISLIGLNRSDVISHPCGTPGYCEPEYVNTKIVKKKSDVYSFGIVLFEVLCGRLCTIEDKDGFMLTCSLVKKYYEENRLDEIVDPSLKGEMSLISMNRLAAIAYRCLHDEREQRPTMGLVVKELEELLKLQDGFLNFDNEEIDQAIALPLAKEDERNVCSLVEDDTKSTVYLSLKEEEEDQKGVVDPPLSEEDHKGKKVIDDNSYLEEHDEELTKASDQLSLNIDSPLRNNYGSLSPRLPSFFPGVDNRICAGCNGIIGYGRFLNCMERTWHPECFRCHACNLPISDYEFSLSEKRPFHISCYKEHYHPKCEVCKNFIPTNVGGLIEYRAHPFWLQKYCPAHERDGTPRCCSCERMEPRDAKYFLLDDGRKLCLQCLESAIVDTDECQPLYLEIQDFYEGLNMKIRQQVQLLLVERQALNEAMEGEKHGHSHVPETRGLTLSGEQTISTIIKRPRIGVGRIITEPYKLVRKCETTAILILYSLPRLLTGSILVHEMMHAWLRLKGYSNLPPDVEEGICQVLAHMWLDSEIMAGASGTGVASSSSSAPTPASSKKGKWSEFEKQLGVLFKHQIESDTSATYGNGFREGNKAVLKYGLKRTLDHIRLTGRFPC
ncbi:LIM domain-containing protein HDR3-like [Bidens hawaiensis]|uniref:LIM domain-containing protein HDR3-like n=1 Tax=Bidens hawaiensis TaxID=980011 RepID=UPI00404B16C3